VFLNARDSESMNKKLNLQECSGPRNLVDPRCCPTGLISSDHLARDTQDTREALLANVSGFPGTSNLHSEFASPSHDQISFEKEFCVDQYEHVNYSLRGISSMQIKVSTAKRKKSVSSGTQFSLPTIAMGRENPWATNLRRIDQHRSSRRKLTTLELCAGGGGQALGFEQAGIEHVGLVEIDKHACATLRLNRPNWNVLETDINSVDGRSFKGVDIISGGLPCPPFSVAGKQLGESDERNLFPAMLGLVSEVRPSAVMIENVRGILGAVFEDYRGSVAKQLTRLGYQTGWKLMNAADFGVPQLRPRVVFVAIRKEYAGAFSWPHASTNPSPTVGQVLYDLLAEFGWKGAKKWREMADEIAPTIVGGSLKHGGPDLGPTRARLAWKSLGVDGLGIANEPPGRDFVGYPRLTVRMVARLQGFPDEWLFAGSKTQTYRQVGNAFPPPFARAVAESLNSCLMESRKRSHVAV
jgi:DNA (cytosine-5)-methyltransferase 1